MQFNLLPGLLDRLKGLLWRSKMGVLFLLAAISPVVLMAADYKSVTIQHSAKAGTVEMNIFNLLADRLIEAGLKDVKLTPEGTPASDQADHLLICLGMPQNHTEISACFKKQHVPPLTDLEPGAEGFLLKKEEKQNLLIAAGIDQRGCLYAVGEILRQAVIRNGKMHFPDHLEICTAPAFEVRGTQVGQSDVSINIAKVRPWTDKDVQRAAMDYALAGANTFQVSKGLTTTFLKSYGLMSQKDFGPNTAGGKVPKEWEGKESIGREGYICPSVPAARHYMIDQCEKEFSGPESYDFVKFFGGDGGGCECDRCKPYGFTFIMLCEDLAAVIHKYHPETRIYFTNQKFDNADDLAILAYLQEKPRTWLWAWGYGPGSDANSWQPGHRQTHRMDLFHYPGFGPYNMYPKELLHQLPPQQKLVYYNEITHWKYAQHALVQMWPRADCDGNLPPHWCNDILQRRPDQYLTQVFNRRSWFTSPRNYYRIFNDLLPYGVGDITHSDGYHDHFQQWMWQRLLWAPRTPLDDIIHEYCTTIFGPEAASLMAKALLLAEESIIEKPGTPLPEKTCVKECYDLVKQAGKLIPENVMKIDWLWCMYMQKATLDRYTQLSVTRQMELQKRIEKDIADAIRDKTTLKAIDEALTRFDLQETVEMKSLYQEAKVAGEQSNANFGVRNDGFFTLQHDFIGLGWTKRQLERARAAKGKERDELLRMIVDYENPGEGGFYDNLGTANIAPHVVFGYPYDHGQPYVTGMLDEGNRLSQRAMHYTQNEKQGVTLHYDNLDQHAAYKLRVTLVRPWYQDRYAPMMNQKSESIYANDIPIAKNVELPFKMSDFFTFDIPAGSTATGELTIRFEKASDVAVGDRVSVEQWRNAGGWGTLVSEVWLIRKK